MGTVATPRSTGPSVYLFGATSFAMGVVDLVWWRFPSGYEPIQVFGDRVPGVAIYLLVAALGLCTGGLLVTNRRTARAGAATLATLYFAFALLWTPRLYYAPHYLGLHAAVFTGVLDGLFQQAILCAAALVIYASTIEPSPVWTRRLSAVRWVFGISCIDFGLQHYLDVAGVASLIPKWFPGAGFWTVLSGTGFILSGIAFLSGVLDVLAARLLAVMLLVMSAVVLVPQLFVFPRDQGAWSANAFNLTAVAAAWVLAEWLQSRPRGPAAAAK
ncbi:MAG TPA: hypothetical protein VMF61_15220 [Candidatus Acidoferrales bacterium]|nr:hypothetical protein [Candidatus Acidoferrales bacterium]